MAERLETFGFYAGRPRNGSRYDAWLDGAIYRLVVGEDIPSIATARTYLHERAADAGLKLRTNAVDDGKALVVQAYTPNGVAPRKRHSNA